MAVVGTHRDCFSGYLEIPPPWYLRARQRSLGHWFPTRQLANPYLKHCPPCWHNRTMAPPHPANQTIRASRSPLKVSGVVNKLCNLGFTCCLSPSPLTGAQVWCPIGKRNFEGFTLEFGICVMDKAPRLNILNTGWPYTSYLPISSSIKTSTYKKWDVNAVQCVIGFQLCRPSNNVKVALRKSN